VDTQHWQPMTVARSLLALPLQVVLEPSTSAAGRYRRSLKGGSIASGTAEALGTRRLLRHGGNDDDDHGGFFGGHHGGRGANCTNGTANGTFVDDDADDNSGSRNSTSSYSTAGSNSTDPATTDVLNPNTGNRCVCSIFRCCAVEVLSLIPWGLPTCWVLTLASSLSQHQHG
jgi:hypothetical protein